MGLYRPGKLGAVGGARGGAACRGRHGCVWGGVVLGRGGTGTVSGGAREVWACRCRSGASREGAGRPAWCKACGAQQLLDRMSAGSAPMITGGRRGPGARGGHGEVQGDRGQLLDMVVCCFAAGW